MAELMSARRVGFGAFYRAWIRLGLGAWRFLQVVRSLCQQSPASASELAAHGGLAALTALLSVGDLDSRLECLAAEALETVLTLPAPEVATLSEAAGTRAALVRPACIRCDRGGILICFAKLYYQTPIVI